ncbi:hypothetical protein EC844_12723 [Acinetobacter calcoaceticus]|uniref:4-aminobutyrate aminotransferase n=1 Tax=Acinetobacter calcoaceticus TaxID=471 RepID=A0A4R1XJH4_ACICA|nr:hypothetical protein EC844_12723 [Acinetobacter calcoaceticus]
MNEFNPTLWPERLQQAMRDKQQLAKQQLYFAPIRHHSPACAYALQHYIAQLQPTHILIEAPQSFQFLLSSLLDEATRPPIAIFAQASKASSKNASATAAKATQATDSTTDSDETDAEPALPELASAYFPFCEYSPEWVALKRGQALQAKLEFIDLSWAKQSSLDQAQRQVSHSQRSLMSERYLAHSQYIQQLATQLHCRNHDELWDHLFELQTPVQLQQPEQFFDDVFSWCALARLDYEPEVLLQDASLHREDQMWQQIHACLAPEHKVLVVTGGFHTLALIELLARPKQAKRYEVKATAAAQWQEQAWLIRYSFDRLDALNGYASGMPSPAYYQQFWLDLNTDTDSNSNSDPAQAQALWQQQFLNYLSQLCHHLDAASALEITTFIAIKNTAEVAWRLAELREHYRPSRYDLLDALQSALIKGELEDGQQQLFELIFQFLSGQQLGQVHADQNSPALLANVYKQVEKYRFNLNDTLQRQRKLDVYRKPLHQEISQYLHLLEFVECGFAQRLSGPDYVLGASLDLLFEEWRYAWTPSVEARLIELAEQGDQLHVIALAKLQAKQEENQQQGLGQSAAETAKLLALACRLGLKKQLTRFNQQLNLYLETDQNLASVIAAAQQLYYLWHGRTLLQLPEALLQHSLILALGQACFLLDQLYATQEERIDENLKHLKHLHELILNAQQQMPQALRDFNRNSNNNSTSNSNQNGNSSNNSASTRNNSITTRGTDSLLELMYQQIDIAQLRQLQLSKLLGAVEVLQFLDQRISQDQLSQSLKLSFATGSDADQAVQYLQGMFFIAPEIFVQSNIAIEALHLLMSQWSEEYFIHILPDLRYVFSQLSPKQTRQVAGRIAELTGLSDEVVLDQVFAHISEQDLLAGVELNQQLQQLLAFDHLSAWFSPSSDTALLEETSDDK